MFIVSLGWILWTAAPQAHWTVSPHERHFSGIHWGCWLVLVVGPALRFQVVRACRLSCMVEQFDCASSLFALERLEKSQINNDSWHKAQFKQFVRSWFDILCVILALVDARPYTHFRWTGKLFEEWTPTEHTFMCCQSKRQVESFNSLMFHQIHLRAHIEWLFAVKAKVFGKESNTPAHLASPGSFPEDLSITYITEASSEGGADTGAISSLKMLKLARLGRILWSILGRSRPPWPRCFFWGLGFHKWIRGVNWMHHCVDSWALSGASTQELQALKMVLICIQDLDSEI